MEVILFLLILFQTGYQFEIDHWGNHFVLTFLQNGYEDVKNSLVITTREESTISVTFHELNQTEELYLNAQESHTVVFTASTTAKPSLQVLPLKAVSIEASKAISVYGFTESVDPRFHSKDGFLVLPVPSLGVEYLAVTCEQDGPQIAIAAVENNTEVEIQIRCYMEVQCYRGLNVLTYPDNHVLTFLMNEHDVVSLYCISDITGSIVHSTKPVTVISGCSCQTGPSMIDCDHLSEMMPPTTEQGNEFVVATPPGSTSFTFLRIVSTNNVTVHDGTGASYSLQTPSRFKYVAVSEPELCLISDKPMIVVMYISTTYSSTYDNVDALMTVVPPLNKYASDYSINIEADSFNDPYTNIAVLICKVGNCPINSIGFKSICHGRYDVKRETIFGFITWESLNPFMVFILARSSDTCVGYPAGMTITDYSGVSECSSNPCFNNGWCLEYGTTYRCRCWGGYSGDNCAKDPLVVLVENGTISGTVSTLKTSSSLQTTDHTTVLPITTGTKVTYTSSLVPASKSTASTSNTVASTLPKILISNTKTSTPDPGKQKSDATKPLDLGTQRSDTTVLISDSTIQSYTVSTTGNPTSVNTSLSTNTPFITVGLDSANNVTTQVFTNINASSPSKQILRLCGCPCSRSAKKPKTPKLVTVEEILKVQKEKLGKAQRRKNSAVNLYDSETNLGYSACSMLLFVILLIVITDVCKIMNWFIEWWKQRKFKARVGNMR